MTMLTTTANGTHPHVSIEAAGSAPDRAINVFGSFEAFTSAWRMAGALSSSTIVPKAYQGEEGRANCMIAIELASRIGASVFMVMQSLDVIQGRPSWSAKFLIGTVNAGKRFTPLRFRWSGAPGKDDWGCRAYATDLASGEELVGTSITIGIAKAEGWYDRNGSKWKTIPEQMLQYRAAAFWTRVYCPEIGMGLVTSEEAADMPPDVPAVTTSTPAALEQALLASPPAQPSLVPVPATPAKPAEAKPADEPRPNSAAIVTAADVRAARVAREAGAKAAAVEPPFGAQHQSKRTPPSEPADSGPPSDYASDADDGSR